MHSRTGLWETAPTSPPSAGYSTELPLVALHQDSRTTARHCPRRPGGGAGRTKHLSLQILPLDWRSVCHIVRCVCVCVCGETAGVRCKLYESVFVTISASVCKTRVQTHKMGKKGLLGKTFAVKHSKSTQNFHQNSLFVSGVVEHISGEERKIFSVFSAREEMLQKL